MPSRPRPRVLAAFTLIELMVVVGIIAIVMTASIPFMRRAIDSPKGMPGAFKLFNETCQEARAMAILQQTITELRIRGDGSLEVSRGRAGLRGVVQPVGEP